MGAATEDDVQHAGGEIVISYRKAPLGWGRLFGAPESSGDIREVLFLVGQGTKDLKSGIILINL